MNIVVASCMSKFSIYCKFEAKITNLGEIASPKQTRTL